MEKKRLRKLRKLYPTKRMMQMAREDAPKIENRSWGKIKKYRYGIYMRCQILEGILKASFFLTEHMRLGAESPVYELFIHKDTGEFCTWDVAEAKWRTAKADMLDWPEYTWHSETYINPAGYRSIQKYLGTKCGGYKGILEYQQEVRKKELKERYRRETEPWDLAMGQIPPLPKDWPQWADKQGMTQHYIFYDYSRKKEKTGYCTGCEREVPIQNPRHNSFGICKRCRRKIQYKARGKAGNFSTDSERAYLIQRYEEGFVIREFSLRRHYRKGEYETPEREFHERERTLYDRDFNSQNFYYGMYKQHEVRWIKAYTRSEGLAWLESYDGYEGKTYRRTLPGLRERELRKTGLVEYIYGCEKTDPVLYLKKFLRNPELEQLVKAGFARLAKEIIRGKFRDIRLDGGGELAKKLGVDRARMKRMRENGGGMRFLCWLRREKAEDTVYDDADLRYLEEKGIAPEDMDFIRNRMGLKKACNFLKKQEGLSGRNAKQLLSTYEDYLLIAGRLKMDTEMEIVYRPKDLKKAHDKAVELCGGRNMARRAGEIADKFPDIDEICEEIRKKYAYSEKKYLIVVPERIEDIIREGEILGHCLHSSDRYFERIQTRESYIVFLRKTEEPDKPYYTLEIEPDGTARQKRTAGDKQNADLEEAKSFIRRWQQEVQKRLTEEDRKLAEKSSLLRIEEFQELRKEKKKVWRGALAGKLLVDVLEADLMEAREAAMS